MKIASEHGGGDIDAGNRPVVQIPLLQEHVIYRSYAFSAVTMNCLVLRCKIFPVEFNNSSPCRAGFSSHFLKHLVLEFPPTSSFCLVTNGLQQMDVKRGATALVLIQLPNNSINKNLMFVLG